MRYFLTVGATLVALGMHSGATAQSLRDVTGPAEVPPSSYTGLQYVDSKGCVFIRAGAGGAVRWIPRVNRDRTVLCGQKPTTVVTPQTNVSVPQAPKPVVSTAPIVVPVRPLPPAAPVVQPIVTYSASQSWTTRSRTTGQMATPTTRKTVIVPRELTHGNTDDVTYRATWDDGRLNPMRGLRPTAHAVPVPSVSSRTAAAVKIPTQQPVTRARAAAVPNAAMSGRFVQVGTFGVISNAQNTVGRLKSAGLPAHIAKSGRYNIVLVGPFNAAADMNSALHSVRKGGFADAFVR